MVVGVGGLRNVGARKSEGRGEEALINGRYGVLRTTGKRNSSQEFTTRPWNIHRGCFLPLLGYESSIGGPAVRTRRVPSERLRLVSKSHLTLTWGGVMKQHDLRFAAPCSCLIETSVAHPPILERESILAWSSRQGVRTPHRAARACATRIYTRVYILRVTIIVLERETRYCATVESRLRGSRPIAFHAGEEISLSLSLLLSYSLFRARAVERFLRTGPLRRWTRSRRPNGWGRHPGRYELCSGARHTGKFRRKSLWKVSFAPRERTSY